MIRKAFLGVIGALSIAGTANAADIYRREAVGGYKDGPVYAANTWTGFYIGGNAGAAFNDNKNKYFLDSEGGNDTAEAIFKNNRESTEFVGGVHVGYNFQQGHLVFGIEGDATFGIDNIDYLASVRGRLGYSFGDFLVYGTGGVAFIGMNDKFSVQQPEDASPFRFNNSRDEVGYVVGGGVEKKITPNWSIGAEGLYYNFDNNARTYRYDAGTDAVTVKQDQDFWSVRGRLTYHVTQSYEPLK